MIKFFFDAMYYQFFIYNRDKFKLEDPHEPTRSRRGSFPS